MTQPTTKLTIAIAALLALACGGPSETDAGPELDAGRGLDAALDAGRDASADAGPGVDAGSDAGPMDALTVTRWGERLYGTPLAVRRIGRELWIGTAQVVAPESGQVRAGLARLDLDTGEVRRFEAELPTFEEPFSGLLGPTPTASVVADGARRLVAARAGVLAIDGDDVTLHPFAVGAGAATPSHLVLDEARRVLWVSTSQGLLEVDPDAFTLTRAHGAAELGGTVTGALALDPTDGAVYVAVYPDSAPSHLAKVSSGGVARLQPGADGPGGRVGDVVFSASHGGAFVALGAWDPAEGGVIFWDGVAVRSVTTEGSLSIASFGERGPFGASTLALEGDVLVVGGHIRGTGPISPLIGGGLAWLDVADLGDVRFAGTSVGAGDLPGDHVTSAALDLSTGRTFLALRHPCSDVRLGNVGVHALTFEGDEPRFAVPILSGVRALARVGETLHVGLRDDSPGYACEGVTVQEGFAAIGAQRAAHVPANPAHDLEGWAPGRFGVTEVAPRAGRFALAGTRVEAYVGTLAAGRLFSPPLDFGTSLWPLDVAWAADDTLWVAGRTSHAAGDPPQVADVGPRGAARITFDDRGGIAERTLFVRQDRDGTAGVVEGLPSAEVYDVVIDEAGAAILVCGLERLQGSHDRSVGEPFELDGAQRPGGVARVGADGSIDILADGTQVPDGRAGALGPDGALYVLDAERGLLTVADGVASAVALDVPAGATPLALHVGEDALVATYDVGAFVRLGEEETFVRDVGFVWAVEASRDVLLLGTDRGLVRVVPQGVADPGEPAAPAGGPIPFRRLPPVITPDAGTDAGPTGLDGGTCLPEGTPCAGRPSDCCPGLGCGGSGIIVACVPS